MKGKVRFSMGVNFVKTIELSKNVVTGKVTTFLLFAPMFSMALTDIFLFALYTF